MASNNKRLDALQQYYNTAFSSLSDNLALDRIIDRSWLKDDRPLDECIHELYTIAQMHTENLAALDTDEGIRYYLTNLDFPSALTVDAQAKSAQKNVSPIAVIAVPQSSRSTAGKNLQNQPTMNEEEKLERTFLVQCSKEQLIALGKYMNQHGIFFRKCSDGINTEAHAEIFPPTQETADGTLRPQ